MRVAAPESLRPLTPLVVHAPALYHKRKTLCERTCRSRAARAAIRIRSSQLRVVRVAICQSLLRYRRPRTRELAYASALYDLFAL